jgi:transcriptional regulator with XRE-family HTH domain
MTRASQADPAPLSRQPTLGDVVRDLRNQKGWTQSELVLKLDGAMDQGQLSRLEGGTLKTPRLPVLRKLGEVLGVPPGRLLKLSRFPGAPILSDSLEAALVELPQEKFPVIEQLVRCASGPDNSPPDSLTQADWDAISDFLQEFEGKLGRNHSGMDPGKGSTEHRPVEFKPAIRAAEV